MTRRLAPSVNAGSMADIAFLLLIFFLVSTTIETDVGIMRKLPPIIDHPSDITIKKKNIFRVELNQFNELLVDGAIMKVKDLKRATIAFLDNGGGSGELACTYCKGGHSTKSSDNPNKAVISLVNSRETNYATYIAVQNELISAYTELRNREAKKKYGISYVEMKKHLKKVNSKEDKQVLKERIKTIQSLYPEKISEAEPRKQY